MFINQFISKSFRKSWINLHTSFCVLLFLAFVTVVILILGVFDCFKCLQARTIIMRASTLKPVLIMHGTRKWYCFATPTINIFLFFLCVMFAVISSNRLLSVCHRSHPIWFTIRCNALLGIRPAREHDRLASIRLQSRR